jgi:hypothetical protein
MRLQKEEKIVLLLLLMALGSLSVAWWAFDESLGAFLPSGLKASEVEGMVKEMKTTKNGGHLVILLDSVPTPIFVASYCGSDEVRAKVKKGDFVRVRGELSQFGGADEIKVKSSRDISRLDSPGMHASRTY